MDLREFLKSILLSWIDGLRRNKLPGVLSLIALIVTTALALTSDFDERPWYRKWILPEVQKAEQPFFIIMEDASQEQDDLRRLHYFLEGHRRAKAALRILRTERPMTDAGRRAHRELLRYYELVDEHLAIIRTEMSLNEAFDYIGEWKRRNAELMSIRGRWQMWLQPD